jgi:cytoskeletal protein RodZ
MTTFSEELRHAREEKNISLAEISKSTRINLKYLEALDQGSFDILPQAYIRAFIREYANAVGLSPVEILQKYDILITGKYASGQTPTQTSGWTTGAVPELHEPAHDAAVAAPTEEFLVKQRSMRTIVIIASIVVLCSLVLAYVANYIWVTHSLAPARETPFQEVVREKEAKNAPPPKADTAAAVKHDRAAVAAAPLPRASSDSLTLNIHATAVVWMSIVRDTGTAVEMLLQPNQTRILRTKKRFIVTTGNAGGASFHVNGKDLGVLGKEGIVLRSIVITAEGVKK